MLRGYSLNLQPITLKYQIMIDLFKQLGELFKPQVLLFKATTDADLNIDKAVAYKDKYGEYTEIGIIEDITEQDGCKLYTIDGAAYRADELKLLSN